MFFLSSKKVSPYLYSFGSVALGLLMLVVNSQEVKAFGVRLGSDYVVTQDGTFFDFGGPIGRVDFIGEPLDSDTLGDADTVIQRLQDVPLSQGDSGMTRIEVTQLSLRSVNSVNGFNIFVGLTPDTDSTGYMTINHEFADNSRGETNIPGIQGTFSSEFEVFFTASFVPVDGEDPIPCPVASCDFRKRFLGSGEWGHGYRGGATVLSPFATDQDANIHTNPVPGLADFFISDQVTHDTDDGSHIVAAPEPTSILASCLILGIGGYLKRRYKKRSVKA